jgi:hypothetical protein
VGAFKQLMRDSGLYPDANRDNKTLFSVGFITPI